MAAVAELTATNKRLVEQLTAVLAKSPPTYTAPPPGIPAITPASTLTSQTSHMVNTSGVACPVILLKSGRYHFVTGQYCSHFRKMGVRHLPQDCLELPQNAERKAKVEEMKARDKAIAAAKKASKE